MKFKKIIDDKSFLLIFLATYSALLATIISKEYPLAESPFLRILQALVFYPIIVFTIILVSFFIIILIKKVRGFL